jgi:hypothetical protein
LFSVPALADNIPGTAYVGRAYYASTEADPIAVNFVADKPSLTPETAKRQSIVTSGVVPRGFIIFAVPYATDIEPVLPEEIWTTHLVLLLHKSGEPYLAFLDKLQKSEALSERAATASMRVDMATANLQTVDWPRYRELITYTRAPRRGSTEDGLDVYFYGPRGPIYYRDHSYPALQVIQCRTEQARANANQFCTYELRLSQVLRARIDFVDFRFHGGRAFVHERLRQLEEQLCSFFSCDGLASNSLPVNHLPHERSLPPPDKKGPDNIYRLVPPEQRPADRVPCAEALATDPLPKGKQAVDEIRGFGEIFGRIIEKSDCRREQILKYVTDLGARRDKSTFRAENEMTEYFLLNTSLNPWYLFWWPEHRVILSFDYDGNLTYSGWSRHG